MAVVGDRYKLFSRVIESGSGRAIQALLEAECVSLERSIVIKMDALEKFINKTGLEDGFILKDICQRKNRLRSLSFLREYPWLLTKI